MDAKTYLTQRNRMTKNCAIYCGSCPLGDAFNEESHLSCTDLEHGFPDKAVAIVQKWADEHPECDPDGKTEAEPERDPDGETETEPECDPNDEKTETFLNRPISIENHGTVTINLS